MINYRNYKNLWNKFLRIDFIKELSNNIIPEDDFIGSLDVCKMSLDYYVSPKKKYIRVNQVSFMAKEFNKEIMTRSRLRNRFLRFRSEENWKCI